LVYQLARSFEKNIRSSKNCRRPSQIHREFIGLWYQCGPARASVRCEKGKNPS
jgi:hypothetical protein